LLTRRLAAHSAFARYDAQDKQSRYRQTGSTSRVLMDERDYSVFRDLIVRAP
jgi:hypothetical protein